MNYEQLVRSGWQTALGSAILGGTILAMIEGVGMAVNRMMSSIEK